MMNDDKPVNLFEDVDLKNIKAEIVPAKILYLGTLKSSLILFSIFFIFTLFNLLLSLENYQISIFFLPILELPKKITHLIFSSLISGFVPLIFASVYIWKYMLFQHGVAINLKHGDKIAQIVKKFSFAVVGLYFLISFAASFFLVENIIVGNYGDGVLEMSLRLILQNFIIFLITGAIGSIIFDMELKRLGLSQFLKNINNILSSSNS